MAAAMTVVAGRRVIVEPRFKQKYAHRGLRGSTLLALAGVALFATPWAVVSESLDMAMAGGTVSDQVRYNSVCVVLAALALGTALVVERRDIARIERWQQDGWPADTAPRILLVAIKGPLRWTAIGMVMMLVPWSVVTYYWLGAVGASETLAALLVFGGVTMASVVVWPVSVLLHELAVQPWLADFWQRHPDVVVPARYGQSLRARVLLPIPAMTLPTGYDVGLAVAVVDDPVVQVVVALAAGLFFAGTFALLLRLAANNAVLRPLDRLAAGVAGVAAGDLTTRVAITTTDELAAISRSFNAMTQRLAAHDAEVRESRARIVAAADESRRQIERDLHDGAQQYLVMLEIKLALLARDVADDPKLAALAEAVRADLRLALDDLRDVAHGLYPAILEAEGLTTALAEAGRRSTAPVTVRADAVGRMPAEVEAAIYFCCFEAMQNAAKYAGKDARVEVHLQRINGTMQFTVADNGLGYGAESVEAGFGLQDMADRIGALGGTLTISSAIGGGTTVAGSVPVETAAALV